MISKQGFQLNNSNPHSIKCAILPPGVNYGTRWVGFLTESTPKSNLLPYASLSLSLSLSLSHIDILEESLNFFFFFDK